MHEEAFSTYLANNRSLSLLWPRKIVELVI